MITEAIWLPVAPGWQRPRRRSVIAASMPVAAPSISVFFPCYNDARTIGDLVAAADAELRR